MANPEARSMRENRLTVSRAFGSSKDHRREAKLAANEKPAKRQTTKYKGPALDS